MRILYISYGGLESTAFHRAQALERIGHELQLLDIGQILGNFLRGPILTRCHFYSGYRFLQSALVNSIAERLSQCQRQFDLVWVDSGEWLGRRAIKVLKRLACPVLLYNLDDPTGPRDQHRFGTLRRTIAEYDACVVVRAESKQEFQQTGAKHVIRVWRSYDEIAHAPFSRMCDIPEKFRSEVCFVGTWMRCEDRGEFLLKLARSGIELAVWGNGWKRSRQWSELRNYYRGPGLFQKDYVAALQGSKICLGLLSKLNRDLHTQRSMEIPFAGGLLCGERTAEHASLYQDGTEAMFWSSAEECIDVCRQLLGNAQRRESIRLAGMKKVRQLHVGNEDICRTILDSMSGSKFV